MADIMTERTSTAHWSGTLFEGSGNFSVGSGAFGPLDVSWARRAGEPEGATSPEELIAAAHASCYAMAVSYALSVNGTPAQDLEVSSTLGFGRMVGGCV
jgi:osmotically inducible protein OsmC